MGNKINPNCFRYSINNGWYIKTFSCNYFNISIYNKIKKYLNNTIGKCNYEEIYLEILENLVIVTIYSLRPGFIIGKNGFCILNLKKYILDKFNIKSFINVKESFVFKNFSFIFSNLFIKIFKRENYKKFLRNYLKNILNNIIKGIKIKISGRINGIDISRDETFKKGKLPLQSYSNKIFFKQKNFITKFGKINIKIWFCFEYES
ncbi:KH domain-containing protein [Candidatus Vidania fulgoroideorum]